MTTETETGSVAGDEGAPAPEAENTATTPAETQETTTEQQEAEPEGDKPEGEEKPAKQPWFQKRIAQLTARTAAQEAELSALRARSEGKEPDAADIDRIATQRAAEMVQQRELLEASNRTAEKGAAEYKDWEQARTALVTNFRDELAAKPEFLEAVTALDHGHAVFRHLGLNPEDADRILSLPSAKMGVELAKLERKLSAPAETKPAPVSKAPKPIKPIAGTATPEPDPEKMDMDEWVKWRRTQLKKR